MFNSFPQPIPDRGGGSNIKSVQRGQTIFTNGVGTINVPITVVDLAKSLLIVTLSLNGSSFGNANETAVKGKLTSESNLELIRIGTSNGVTVFWQIIEYENVKNLQRGDYTSPTLENRSITISTIDPAKSIIVASYNTTKADTQFGLITMGYRIKDASTIEIINGGASYNVSWQVIEF